MRTVSVPPEVKGRKLAQGHIASKGSNWTQISLAIARRTQSCPQLRTCIINSLEETKSPMDLFLCLSCFLSPQFFLPIKCVAVSGFACVSGFKRRKPEVGLNNPGYSRASKQS